MKRYKTLEHIGDVKIRAFGKTFPELFLNAMRGMTEVLKATKRQGDKATESIKRKMHVRSADLNTLLADFLNEVNYLTQTNREIYEKAKFLKFSDTQLESELSGYKVENFGEEIKAVTYHGLEIKKNLEGFFEAEILFDI